MLNLYFDVRIYDCSIFHWKNSSSAILYQFFFYASVNYEFMGDYQKVDHFMSQSFYTFPLNINFFYKYLSKILISEQNSVVLKF